MKRRPSAEEWAEEFRDFVAAPHVAPPRRLSDQVLAKVRADLDPALWLVAAKLSLIHLLSGSVTLLFCPQFGIRLGGGMGMMGLLMQYGERACMLGCGAVFMAGSALIASLALRAEEVRKIRRTEALLFPALGLFSLGAFACAGGALAAGLAAFWFVGSVLAGMGALELGWWVRSRA